MCTEKKRAGYSVRLLLAGRRFQAAVTRMRGLAAAILLLAAGVSTAAGPSFTLLGLGPDGCGSLATGVSSNGAVVVGTYKYTSMSDDWIPFRWTNGATALVALDGALIGSANSVSADGTVVVGVDRYDYSPYRWTGVVERLDWTLYEADVYDVSADGSIAVGYSKDSDWGTYRAYRWTGTSGEPLPDVPDVDSKAYGVSADGSVVVGYAGNNAVRWTSSGMQGLGSLDGASFSCANAVSADGLVVVGKCDFTSPAPSKAFRWTAAGGMKELGSLYINGVEYDQTTATGVSGDGSVVVGTATSTAKGSSRTFILYNNEMYDLQSLLEANGVDFGGCSITLDRKTAISSNGRHIVGTCSNASFNSQAYRIDLGDSALAISAKPLDIRNDAVADVATNSAWFHATLTSTGTAACAVAVLWDTQDRGKQWDGWAHTNWFNDGAANPGWTNNTPFRTNITAAADGLLPDRTYYYRYAATNATTNAVAATVKYFITGEVKVEATDNYAKYPGDTGEFRIYRPAGCADVDITVSFTLGDSAENGREYERVPSDALLAAGSTQAVVTITPKFDHDLDGEWFVLTLAAGSGLYPFGTPANEATLMIGPHPAADWRTYYVNKENPTPRLPYTNWVDAATNIQDAIDAAGDFGCEVLVTNGVYDTGGIVVSAAGPATNRVALNKAILVRSVNGPEVTIIKGYQLPSGAPDYGPCGPSAVRCAYVGSGATLSGFTLTNGATANEPQGDISEIYGGGVWCETSGMLTNCIITGNAASQSGGGVYGGELYNCIITGNRANGSYGGGYNRGGGGAYEAQLYNCTISGNDCLSGLGGGVKDCTLTNCTISVNRGRNGGGAYGGTLDSSTLDNNTASANDGNHNVQGGGAYNATLRNCTLSNNKAEDLTNNGSAEGGGASGGTLYNCLLFGNSVQAATAGETLKFVQGGGASSATLLNCTIASNMVINPTVSNFTNAAGGGVYGSTLTNCIVYYNTVINGVSNNYAGGTLQYSCTTPLPGTGGGNTTNEPRFRNAARGDYTLYSSSPCIDAGMNQAWMVDARDLAGNPRKQYGGSAGSKPSPVVDMGAYEAVVAGTVLLFR